MGDEDVCTTLKVVIRVRVLERLPPRLKQVSVDDRLAFSLGFLCHDDIRVGG